MKAWIYYDDDYGFFLVPADHKDAPDPGDGMLPVEVPEGLWERLQAAEDEYHAAVEAIEQATGYDRHNHRLTVACGRYEGKPVKIGERVFWDPCEACGWRTNEHVGPSLGPNEGGDA